MNLTHKAGLPGSLSGFCFLVRKRRLREYLTNANRHDHGHTFLITSVLITVKTYQILLLKLDCQQDVNGRRYCKNQMRNRHRRRCPERKQPTQVKRMTHMTIQNRSSEFQLRVLFAAQEKIYLPKAEKIEMVY